MSAPRKGDKDGSPMVAVTSATALAGAMAMAAAGTVMEERTTRVLMGVLMGDDSGITATGMGIIAVAGVASVARVGDVKADDDGVVCACSVNWGSRTLARPLVRRSGGGGGNEEMRECQLRSGGKVRGVKNGVKSGRGLRVQRTA